jgi:hypothetical protein
MPITSPKTPIILQKIAIIALAHGRSIFLCDKVGPRPRVGMVRMPEDLLQVRNEDRGPLDVGVRAGHLSGSLSPRGRHRDLSARMKRPSLAERASLVKH